jgi:hypothetical protein
LPGFTEPGATTPRCPELEDYALYMNTLLVDRYSREIARGLSYATRLKLALVIRHFDTSSSEPSPGLLAFFSRPLDNKVWEALHVKYQNHISQTVSFHNFQRSFDFLLIPDWNPIAEQELPPMQVNDLQPDCGNNKHLPQPVSVPLSPQPPDRKPFITDPPDRLSDRYPNGITNHRGSMPTPPYIYLPQFSCHDTPPNAGSSSHQTLPSIRSALGASFLQRVPPTPFSHSPLAGTENIAAYSFPSVPLLRESISNPTRSTQTASNDIELSSNTVQGWSSQQGTVTGPRLA